MTRRPSAPSSALAVFASSLFVAGMSGCAEDPVTVAVVDAGAIVDAPSIVDVAAAADSTFRPDVPQRPDVAPTEDAGPAADIVTPTDVRVPVDAPTTMDASTPNDVPATMDASAVMDVRIAMDAVPATDVTLVVDVPSVCPTLPAPAADIDPWSVDLPSLGVATTRTVTAGGHRDVYLAGPGGVAELAVRLDWGASVVFFGQAGIAASNTLDANDTGRELQLALYDPHRAAQGCAFDASCAGPGPCPASISYLGWDPVQGGDRCGHGTPVLGTRTDGDALEVTVAPLQWNPDWNASTCAQAPCGASGVATGVTYTLRFRFVHPNVAEVSMQVTSAEDLDHAPSTQEFPTLYVGHGGPSTDLPLLLDATGTPVSITTPGNDGFTHREFVGSPWVTWQHMARDYGVGLAMDQGIASWQAWQGDGTHAPYFHNVRAQQSFGLPPHGIVRGRAYLALGSFDTVRSLVPAVLSRRAAFGAVDAPAAGAVAGAPGGTLHVTGWVLDNAPGVTVVPRLDGRDLAALPVSAARPDVCAVYPNYGPCPAPGFDAMVALGVADGCAHTLDVVARDADGNETRLGSRLVQAR